MNMNRVVITGIAPISKNGIGKDSFFKSLYAKELKHERIHDALMHRYESKWYVPYPRELFDNYTDFMGKANKRASKNAMAAVVAANLAIKDANIDKLNEDAAVIMGVGLPNMPELSKTYDDTANNKRIHPLTITHSILNDVSAWISICLGVHGVNYVVSTACASGTTAVGHAYQMIKNGHVNTAIAGGAECLIDDHNITFQSFSNVEALSVNEDGVPRPFSKERTGFLYSEGACCVLVLEELNAALNRNADIYAEIVDYFEYSDGFHIVMMPDNPDSIRRTLYSAFENNKVDYYNAHGTGTQLNDKTEAMILKELSDKYGYTPIVNSTKGIIGHTLGASGAIEAAVCAYSIKNSKIHGNILGTAIEGLNLPKKTILADINCAVSASFGFGGHDAALVFKKCNL